MNISSLNSVFFIGIGGIGMSGLAKYFLDKNVKVYGYDKDSSFITKDLINKGANIFHNYTDIDISKFNSNDDSNLIIYTPAVQMNHPLLAGFVKQGFDIFKRAEVIEQISKKSKCIAIAGTHGKTTTTSILAHIFNEADFSFLAFVGGIMENYNSNYIYSGDDYIIVEADEFDKSFLRLNPDFACITSMDVDHLDVYQDSTKLIEAFREFKNNLKPGGFILSNENVEIDSIKYGIGNDAKYKAVNINYTSQYSKFDLQHINGQIKNIKVQLPGLHNIMNTVAAVTIALEVGITEELILNAISTFKGVERRFSYTINEESLVLIDDYAHHPEEIKQVYSTLKSIYPKEKLLVVFQPHLFSRTRDLMDEFATELSKFDAVILLEIYPAREKPIDGISSQLLLSKIDLENKILCSKSEISNLIKGIGYKINVTLGAGDIGNEVQQIKQELEYAI